MEDQQQQQELVVVVSLLQEEYQSIVRVMKRIETITNDISKLQSVIPKLLPKLFIKLRNNYKAISIVIQQQVQEQQQHHHDQKEQQIRQKIHDTLITVLSNIMKQIQYYSQKNSNNNNTSTTMMMIEIPCIELIQTIFFDSTTSTTTTIDAMDTTTNQSSSSSSSSTSSTATATTISNYSIIDSYTIHFVLSFLNVGIEQQLQQQQRSFGGNNNMHMNTNTNYHDDDNNNFIHLLPLLCILYHDCCMVSSTTTTMNHSTSSSTNSNQQQQQQSTKWAHLILRTVTGMYNNTNRHNNSNNTNNSRIAKNNTTTNSHNTIGLESLNNSSTTTATTTSSSSNTNQFIQQLFTSQIASSTTTTTTTSSTVLLLIDQMTAIVYDLFLDVLLYNNQHNMNSSSNSTIPLNGLSQYGYHRIRSSTTTTSTTTSLSTNQYHWNPNDDSATIIRTQLAILQYIRSIVFPHQQQQQQLQGSMGPNVQQQNHQYHIFSTLSTTDTATTTTTTNIDTNHHVIDNNNNNNSKNIARCIILYIIATTSPYTDIADRSTMDLKQYLDHHQRNQTNNSNDNSTSSRSSSIPSSSSTTTNPSLIELFGDPMILAIELVTYCLGQIHSDTILQQQQQPFIGDANTSSSSLSLGYNYNNSQNLPLGSTDEIRQQNNTFILQNKRRPLDDITQCPIILSFISNKILSVDPILFQCTTTWKVIAFTSIALQYIHRTCCSNTNNISNGLSTIRAKPYICSVQLLHVVSIQLCAYYENIYNDYDEEIAKLLCRCLSVACTVISPIASSSAVRSNSTMNGHNNDGSITIREICYDVVATIARCHRFVLHNNGYVFGRGNASTSLSDSNHIIVVINIDTATTLFGCTANEEERLRSKAVAALDALLAAYCRVYCTATTTKNNNEGTVIDSTNEASNPWLVSEPPMQIDSSNMDSNHTDHSSLAKYLKSLLWSTAQQHQSKASRVASARWASELLKEIDLLSACHLLCYLCGDPDSTAAAIARDGLCLPKHINDNDETMLGMISGDNNTGKYPDFSEFITILLHNNETNMSRQQRYWDFSLPGKASTLRCGLYCLLNDLYGGEDHAVAQYVFAITRSLQDCTNVSLQSDDSSMQRKHLIDLLDECSACLLTTLSTSQFARQQMIPQAKVATDKLHFNDLLIIALSAYSSRSRRYLAGAFGKLIEDLSLWPSSESMSTWIDVTGLLSTLKACEANMHDVEKRTPSLGRLHGSAFVGAHIIHASLLSSRKYADFETDNTKIFWTMVTSIFDLLGRGLLHDDDMVSNACSDSLVIALSFDAIDQPELNVPLVESLAGVLSHLTISLKRFGHSDTVNPARILKLAKASGLCLAATLSYNVSNNCNSSIDVARFQCVGALFDLLGSMASRKEEEVSIVVGEALGDYADSYNPSQEAVKVEQSVVWPTDYVDSFAKQSKPHELVLFVLLRKVYRSTSPITRIACAPALLAIVARGALHVNSHLSKSARPLVQLLLTHVHELQQAFLSLMCDPKGKQFSRESSCLGLAACRGLARRMEEAESSSEGSIADLNNRLLHAFGQTTNFGGSAMMETEMQAAVRRAAEGTQSTTGDNPELIQSEVGGASGIGEAALGAYREMAAASVALGRHDIMYGLLFLSLSHPYWQSSEARHRYSASSLLGKSLSIGNDANSNEFRNVLKPHLGKLIPRILRGCHDPNKQTKEQMVSLWRGLTGGGSAGRQAITDHLEVTIDALIKECSSKLWRARVGACGALSEVIVGREWTELGGGGPVLNDDDLFEDKVKSAGVRLVRIWNVVSRALDDVQGSVRDIGETVARAARALTIRLCVPSNESISRNGQQAQNDKQIAERDAAAAAGTAIWWLMCKGLNHTCPEVTGASMSTLVEVIGLVRPAILEPSLSTLLTSLLLAVSALEPAALNYMQLRATDQEGLERARLQLSQVGPLAVAITKCMEIVPKTSIETQQTISPALDSALRLSAGFATRAAVADAVSTLCTSCPAVFRYTGALSTNPSVRLLRAFYFASERERGAAAKDKMIHALGNLAAICPASSVRSLAVRACERYRFSTGNNFDPSSRRATSATLRTIAVRASHVFSDGGRGDIWCTRVLPVAYIGRKDADSKIASMWQEVWDEGGSVANILDSSAQKFGTQLEEKLLQSLVKECVSALQDVSWTSRVAGASALHDLCSIGVLAPFNITNCGDEISLLRIRHRANASHVAMTECIQLLCKPRLWNGKSEVLKAVTLLSSKWSEASMCANGVNENEALKTYSWWPIDLSTGMYDDDLCVNDNWFLQQKDEDYINDSEETEKADEESESRKMLDFKNCDEILEVDEMETVFITSGIDDNNGVLTFYGLGRFLIEQAIPSSASTAIDKDALLVYRTTAFRCFRDLLNSFPSSSHAPLRSVLYNKLSPSLLQTIKQTLTEKEIDKRSPPVLTAGAINCIESLLWVGIGKVNGQLESGTNIVHELVPMLKDVGGALQPAWTVREAAGQCAAHIVKLCHDEIIQQMHIIVLQLIDIARQALSDRKFWKVRAAGLTILLNLVGRVGHRKSTTTSDSDNQNRTLESILPQKEMIVHLARTSLNDTESKVTMIATSIIQQMSWWP